MNATPALAAGAEPARPSRWAALWTQAAPAERWRTLQRRFDQRNQRERQLMIAAAAALSLMAADSLWLGPALKAYKAAHGRQVVAQAALQTVQADVARRSDQDSLAARARLAELAAWRQRLRDGDQALRQHEDTLVGADRMVELLEHLLARHGEVRVRAMRSLGRSDLLGPAPGAAASPGQAANATANATADAKSGAPAQPGSPAAAAAPGLYRHGVELVLEGGFADLLSYLRAMEALPQRVLWGSVNLKVEQHPKSVLTLRVYTISRERHWLEI